MGKDSGSSQFRLKSPCHFAGISEIGNCHECEMPAGRPSFRKNMIFASEKTQESIHPADAAGRHRFYISLSSVCRFIIFALSVPAAIRSPAAYIDGNEQR